MIVGQGDGETERMARYVGTDFPEDVTLILVGRTGVGKSTTANELRALTGRPLIEIGDFVRADAAEEGQEPLEYARNMFRSGRSTFFARRAADAALRLGPGIIVGPRLPTELSFLRGKIRPTIAIGLVLPASDRWARLARRATSFDASRQAVRDEVEEEWGIARTLEKCDSLISTASDPRTVAEKCLGEWIGSA
jgi:hypothetical protein